MNLKKITALVCALTLSLSAFAGCAKTDGASSNNPASGSSSNAGGTENKTLNIAVFEGGYGKAVWYQLAKTFEDKNPGVKVNITANAKLGDVIRPNLTKQKDVPDFIYLASSNDSGILQSLISSKQLEDLSDVFDKELTDRMLPGALEGPTITPFEDGKIYSAPLFYSVMGLWYDQNLFTKNNWKVPATWDDFYKLGDEAKKQNIGLFTYAAANAPSYNESVVWPSIANAAKDPQALQDVFNYKEGAWKSDAVKKMFGVYTKMKDSGYLMEGTLGMNHTQSQQAFLQDKSLFLPNGTWLEGEMANSPKAEGFKYGFMGVPAFEAGQKPYVWSASEEMYIPKGAANVDLAKKFMKFLYEEETIKTMAEVTKAIPPIKGAVDLVKDIFVDADATKANNGTPVYNSAYTAFKFAEENCQTVNGGFAATEKTELSISKDFFAGINKIFSGEITADALMDQLEAQSKKLAEIKAK